MLQAGIFPAFKGADTFLLWGDADGIAELHDTIIALSRGNTSEIQIDSNVYLSISPLEMGEHSSKLSRSDRGLLWVCPRTVLVEVEALIAGLDEVSSGHYFINTAGLADQMMISKNEYPESLRP